MDERHKGCRADHDLQEDAGPEVDTGRTGQEEDTDQEVGTDLEEDTGQEVGTDLEEDTGQEVGTDQEEDTGLEEDTVPEDKIQDEEHNQQHHQDTGSVEEEGTAVVGDSLHTAEEEPAAGEDVAAVAEKVRQKCQSRQTEAERAERAAEGLEHHLQG